MNFSVSFRRGILGSLCRPSFNSCYTNRISLLRFRKNIFYQKTLSTKIMEITDNITEDTTIVSKDCIESEVKLGTLETTEPEEGTRYRLRVSVPKFASAKMIKDLLTERGCEKVQVKKAPKWDYCLINPKTEKQQLDIMDKLKGAKLKNKELYIQVYNYTEKDRQARFDRRKNKKQQSIKQSDIQKSPEERLADQVTPLHAYEYQTQLELKQSRILKSLETFRDNMKELYNKSQIRPSWLFDSELPLDLQPMIHSPILEGYRNKCEFTIGLNMEGEKTVGFLLGGYKDGLNIVIQPDNSIHVSDVAKKIAKSMQNYILQSLYDVYNWDTKQGNWRQITVRSQKSGDVMIIIQIHPQGLSIEQIDQEKIALSEHFNTFAKEEGFNLTSLLIQMYEGLSNGISDKHPFDCISGTPFVHEEMLNCRFRISPISFFQTNTAATELLYQKCGDIVKEIYMSKEFSEPPKLLDMCCGTGTIGIALSKNFGKIIKEVVGIEICKEAVEDAKINATMNGINNVKYILGSVEDSLFALYETFGTAIAIVDPPRSGVHKNVIKAIRKCRAIEHLIYISCDHNAAIKNFTEICRPTTKSSPGIPFKPIKAIGVDLFPHAKHVELIIEFHRNREDSNIQIKSEQPTDIPSTSASQDTKAKE